MGAHRGHLCVAGAVMSGKGENDSKVIVLRFETNRPLAAPGTPPLTCVPLKQPDEREALAPADRQRLMPHAS